MSEYKYYNIDKIVPAEIEISKVFKKFNVGHWLDAGALLGLIRENRLLLWDDDIENACIWNEETSHEKFVEITKELNNLGYDTYYLSAVGALSIKGKDIDVTLDGMYENGEYISRPMHEGLHHPPNKISQIFYLTASVFMYYTPFIIHKSRFRDLTSGIKFFIVSLAGTFPVFIRKKLFAFFNRLSCLAGAKIKVSKIPKAVVSKTIIADFYGEDMPIPHESVKYLEILYGKGWNIPKENWHFHDSDKFGETGIIYEESDWDYDIGSIK